MAKTLTERTGDLLIADFHPSFNREEGAIKHATLPISAESPVGMMLQRITGGWTPVVAEDEADIDGVVLAGPPIDVAANTFTKSEYLILARGPAVINRSALITVDIDGDALDMDDALAALAAVDIQTVRRSTNVS